MNHHQLVTRYWILAISTSYGCECNEDVSTVGLSVMQIDSY